MKIGEDKELEKQTMDFLRQNDKSYYSNEKDKGIEYPYFTDYKMKRISRIEFPSSHYWDSERKD